MEKGRHFDHLKNNNRTCPPKRQRLETLIRDHLSEWDINTAPAAPSRCRKCLHRHLASWRAESQHHGTAGNDDQVPRRTRAWVQEALTTNRTDWTLRKQQPF